jgi:uncharacterized protein (DUF58 family)
LSTTPNDLFDGTAEQVLRRLEVEVERRLDGLLHGDYRGIVPGHGSELGDAREYLPGDDVRRMDWNVTARTQIPHVRESIADRELEAWVLVDRSASLDFGTAACEKRDLATAAVAATGFLTARAGNRFGCLVLEGDRLVTHPARAGRMHVQAVLHDLMTRPRVGEGLATDLGPAVRRLSGLARRRGLAVVTSDFLIPSQVADAGPRMPDWFDPLRLLGTRHDLLAIEVVDPRELELPAVGVLDLIDPESGRRREVHTTPALRRRYADAAAQQREEIARAIRKAGADHLQLRTDRDWLLDVVRFVADRRRRKLHVGPPKGL